MSIKTNLVWGTRRIFRKYKYTAGIHICSLLNMTSKRVDGLGNMWGGKMFLLKGSLLDVTQG